MPALKWHKSKVKRDVREEKREVGYDAYVDRLMVKLAKRRTK